MDTTAIIDKLSLLPHQKQEEVLDFIDFLIAKNVNSSKNKIKSKPTLGSAKGMFTILADFDEPLEDFEEYM